jgi:hypothetical protein
MHAIASFPNLLDIVRQNFQLKRHFVCLSEDKGKEKTRIENKFNGP